MLLWTVQDRLSPGDDESFVEQATRINAPEALQQAGNLLLTFCRKGDIRRAAKVA